MRLPLLFAVLLSSAVHAQAVRPAPSPGPLVVQQPPTYPGATLTPTGAGASHGGLAAPQKALAPPSPNKRLLPPTKEAGLWAADGAPVAESGVRLFDVELPHVLGSDGFPTTGHARWCADTITKAADVTGWLARVNLYPLVSRACFAALTYVGCSEGRFRDTSAHLSPDQRAASPEFHSAKATLDHARSMEARFCRDAPLNDEQKRALQDVLAGWRVITREFR